MDARRNCCRGGRRRREREKKNQWGLGRTAPMSKNRRRAPHPLPPTSYGIRHKWRWRVNPVPTFSLLLFFNWVRDIWRWVSLWLGPISQPLSCATREEEGGLPYNKGGRGKKRKMGFKKEERLPSLVSPARPLKLRMLMQFYCLFLWGFFIKKRGKEEPCVFKEGTSRGEPSIVGHKGNRGSYIIRSTFTDNLVKHHC